MGSNLWVKKRGWVVAALLALGCGGTPLLAVDGTTSSGGVTGTTDSGGGPGYTIQDGGDNTNVGGQSGGGCKKVCAVGECGPIVDGCGNVIECGGCTAPEICGGSGVPSHCGAPTTTCVAKTCLEQGFNCGLQSDGCGGIINCWPGAGDAGASSCPIATMQCVQGTCQTVTPQCVAKTCEKDYANVTDLCGPVSDGCGGTLDCHFKCSSDKVCGLITPGKCDKVTCTPMTCEAALNKKPKGYCGAVEDGCGGLIPNCAAVCTGGDACGGGGVPDVCGQTDGGGNICIRKTAADCAGLCGAVSDGCGGVVDCGGCLEPAICGGGGVHNVCGGADCKPRTCASYNASCGSVPNGCGLTLDCGDCDAPETCGGGGVPNVCGSAQCIPKSADAICQGLCGQQSNGCGGTVDCGGCTFPNTCGGGGTDSVCGAPTCTTQRTCADVGANCGSISDGCNGVIESCGRCASNEICGADKPNVCGVATDPNCTGLCGKIDLTCPDGQDTRLTGTVFAPNATDPLNNALVYVPNGTLRPIPSGPSCDRCADEDLGNPIAGALTGPDGKFVLHNVPAGVDFPLVVKLGKWRRVVTIPAVTRCSSVALTSSQTRLARSMTDATPENAGYVNIPHFAIVSGDVDAIECVLRQIGVADSEFTLPSGNGRIHMYRDNGGTMGCNRFNRSKTACYSTSDADVIQAKRDQLKTVTNGKAKLFEYDVAVLDCVGAERYDSSYDALVHSWAGAGGRLFASHYSYTYLYKNGDYASTATWGGSQSVSGYDVTTGIVDTSFAKGQAFNTWLGNVNAWSPTYSSGYIDIRDPRFYVKAAAAGTDRFIYTDTSVQINGKQINPKTAVEQYAFNTPVGAASDAICGRVLYSAFHVAGASGLGSRIFPSYCSTSAMTAQEKVLEYMIFDLSSCVSVTGATPPKTCKPRSCAEMGANCGLMSDGCGAMQDCGKCTAPESCGGGGVANQCGNYCTRKTCGSRGANCGTVADGCGGILNCDECVAPAVCGGGGSPNICGMPACTPRSCADVGAQCGAISDGCGKTINCGKCTAPLVCGGGGTPNVCGAGSCSPAGCGTAACGFVGDGCGGTVYCGTCKAGYTCVGGACVGSSCKPRTCADAGAGCGFVGDGCGGVLDCGTCVAPLVCGGAGVASQCGGSCQPRSCAAANAACGAISDGCGGIKECGVCPTGSTCGGSGVPNQCGSGTCHPLSCSAVGATCGSVGDGCGTVLNCGPCPAGQSCGGGGVPNKCGSGGCVPRSCSDQKANCGPVADGCGGLLDCGPCPAGQTCGGGGVASQCGSGGGPIVG